MSIGTLGCSNNLRHGNRSTIVAIGYVLRYRPFEKSGFLGDYTQSGPYPLEGQIILDVIVIYVLVREKIFIRMLIFKK